MIDRIITASVTNRVFVALVAAMLAVGGWWALRSTPVDALPDLSDVQVIVYTEYNGQSPQVVEDQVTYPMSTAMLSVPYAKDVRGYSFFGFSLVYVIFEDGTDLYWARSRVLEYLNVVQSKLPDGASAQLGPDATGVGWVYEYVLTDYSPEARELRSALDSNGDGVVELSELPEAPEHADVRGVSLWRYPAGKLGSLTDEPRLVAAFDRDGDKQISQPELLNAANYRGHDLSQLRSVQDWFLRYDLMSVDGVSEVASAGGFVRQYQVEVDPERLRAFGLNLRQVRTAIQRANVDVGGRLIEMAEHEYMVRGQGYLRGVDDLRTIPIGMDPDTHVPILLRQVATVQIGPEVRRGITEWNGEGEVVTGIVVMRSGANAMDVIDGVRDRLAELQPQLPAGVVVDVGYDRSSLISRAIHVLQGKLLEEMAVVAVICLIFLLHIRSALVALITLPLGVLGSFLCMRLLGIPANIMSLSGIAIAIGVMVDASVVMVENLHKHREANPDAPQEELVLLAAKEVGGALFTSLLIVTVSFLPVFALENQEGRLFKPLAWTKTLALATSAMLSITLIPALMVWFVRGKMLPESKNPINRGLVAAYRPVMRALLKRPLAVVIVSIGLTASALWPYQHMGSEFMPPLNEGDLLYMPTTPPGLSITKAKELLQQTDKLIALHPQVDTVLGKIGRADTATDPAPLTMIETTITLTDPATWPAGKTIRDIITELDASVQFPGVTNAWTMPIRTRIDMLATGIKTPVGVKLLGSDLAELAPLAEQLEGVLKTVPGTSSVFAERVMGGHYIDIDVRRDDAARYGLNVQDVMDVVSSAVGGMNITWTVEGLERYPVNMRYPRALRSDPEALAHVAVPTPMGHYVPLAQVADISLAEGPPAIKSEDARQTAWVYVDLETSDVGGYVERAKQVVSAEVDLPPGVSLEWSGQYEYMERANERLSVIVPLTLGLIVILLYAHFRSLGETLMVMLTLPVALTGGVWLMWANGFNFSVAVAVGFIALAGLAAETGVVMIVYLRHAVDARRAAGNLKTRADVAAAVLEGAVERVRPKIMTVATTTIGLLPIMWSHETGTRIMKRVAAPMVGGMVSSVLLTLFVLPALYMMWAVRREKVSR